MSPASPRPPVPLSSGRIGRAAREVLNNAMLARAGGASSLLIRKESEVASSGERSRAMGVRVGHLPVLPTGQMATATAPDRSLMILEYYSTAAEP